MDNSTVNPMKEGWSVYDTVKISPSASPEGVMADINSAISTLELRNSTILLESSPLKNKNPVSEKPQFYDAELADEAYKAGIAALASAKLDEAVQCLTTSLYNCPPHNTSALAKLRALISVTSQQLQSSPN